MFYKLPVIKKMIKNAFKAQCLVVGQTREGLLYTSGSFWILAQDIKGTPKEFKAAIIELVGDLPEPGEVFRAGKDGCQMEIEQLETYDLPKIFGDIDETGREYDKTGICFEWGDRPLRFLVNGSDCALFQEILCDAPDPDGVDHGSGETDILGPIRPMGMESMVWHNDDTWYEAFPVKVNKREISGDKELEFLAVARGFRCSTQLDEAIGESLE